MAIDSIENFIRLLKQSPPGAVFNPWWEVDEENDFSRNAPQIRRKHLAVYFRERLGKTKLAIVGEALGYRGGHFSGIPMTSERLLLGKQPLQILTGVKPRRTSQPTKCPEGFSEPTATIVWCALLKLGFEPDEFVLWNAFPWHSFDPPRGMLSNRTPNKCERAAGLPVLKAFFELFPRQYVVALGKVAAAQLQEFGRTAYCVRHPASGGAKLFRQQIAALVQRLRD